MKRITTFCTPEWFGKGREGYWSIKIINEYTPGFFEKLIGKKPYHTEHTFTNLNSFATALDWRDKNGNEVEAFGVFHVAAGEQLKNHLEKHLASVKMAQIQNSIIKPLVV